MTYFPYKNKNQGIPLLPRTCTSCGESSPGAVFTHHFNRDTRCRVCQDAEVQVESKRHRNWHQRRTKAEKLEFEEFRARQEPKCRICGTESNLTLDHDHITGKPRGILCNNHNIALGKMKDDPVRLEAAALYLEKSREL